MLTNVVNLKSKAKPFMPAAGACQAEVEQNRESSDAFTESEAQQLFERTARQYLNLSTGEFLQLWDAKAFSQEQQSAALRVAALIPLIRHIRAGKKTR